MLLFPFSSGIHDSTVTSAVERRKECCTPESTTSGGDDGDDDDPLTAGGRLENSSPKVSLRCRNEHE